jgi:hypothetical protein
VVADSNKEIVIEPIANPVVRHSANPCPIFSFPNVEMKTSFALTILLLMFFAHPEAYGCTAFMAADSKRVLVGNNEDNKFPTTRKGVPHVQKFYGVARSMAETP